MRVAIECAGFTPGEADMLRKSMATFSAEQMIHVLDRIVCACVVKPRIEMTPNDPTRRKHGVVYCDMVDLDDKLFLFNYVVGGTRDLERFRQESADALGGLRELQEDEGDAV